MTRRLCSLTASRCLGAFLAFACLVSPAEALDLEKRVHRFTLNNGLRVLIVPRSTSPTVALYIRYRAGAVDERDGATGTAHLLEHMLFKGTTTIGTRNYQEEKKVLDKIDRLGRALDAEQREKDKADPEKITLLRQEMETLHGELKRWTISNEIDRLYTEHGAVHLNASTGQDLTTYHVSLPANRIPLWARIEADRMRDPVFREFFPERNVVLEERRQRTEADPDGALYEQFMAAAFAAHPYRRPIIGWPSDIRFLDAARTRQFFLQAHAPEKTVIAMVGDVTPADGLRLVRQSFETIPVQESAPETVTEEPPQRGERRVEVVFDAGPQILVGYHKPAPPAFTDAVFDVIETILTRGRTSRLFRLLVEEKGLAESVRSMNGLPGARYPNLFVLSAVPRHPHTAATLEEALHAEVDRLQTEPVAEAELTRARNHLRTDMLRQMRSNEGMASLLSYAEVLFGDCRFLSEHLARIDRVTAADIQAAAATHLHRGNRTVATLVPRKVEAKRAEAAP